jgi:hypothetical protein
MTLATDKTQLHQYCKRYPEQRHGHGTAQAERLCPLPSLHRRWSPLPSRCSGLSLPSLFPSFRFAHCVPAAANDSEDLSAELLPELSQFSSGVDINKFLARLLILITKGRVSPRRASVMAYVTNQLLHSHRAIARDNTVKPRKNALNSTSATGPAPRTNLASRARLAMSGPS